jgi:hypothetical protein
VVDTQAASRIIQGVHRELAVVRQKAKNCQRTAGSSARGRSEFFQHSRLEMTRSITVGGRGRIQTASFSFQPGQSQTRRRQGRKRKSNRSSHYGSVVTWCSIRSESAEGGRARRHGRKLTKETRRWTILRPGVGDGDGISAVRTNKPCHSGLRSTWIPDDH